MLSKDFHREVIPGVPGTPGVAGGWYCHTPGGGGQWGYQCTSRTEILQANTGIAIPPGSTVTYDVNEDGEVVATITTCYSSWIPDPDPPEPVCQYIEPVDPVAAVPSRVLVEPVVGWDAGANSVTTIAGDCEVVWTMELVAGAYVGLTEDREAVPAPDRIAHGFMFHQRAGVCFFRVVEYGVARSGDIQYFPGDEFAVRRARGFVYYRHNDEELRATEAQFDGEASVASALYASGDRVPTGVVDP